MNPHIAIIVPTRGNFDYVATTIRSVLRNTFTPPGSSVRVIVVDDASPELQNSSFESQMGADFIKACGPRIALHVFGRWNGYIAACNRGLRMARDCDAFLTCVANSDLVFSPGWNLGLERALRLDYALVGPISNAPGTEQRQNVSRFHGGYHLTDDSHYLDTLAAALAQRYAGSAIEGTINGFCMLAKTAVWWANSYDEENVFRPSNPRNSKGEVNPSPKMTLSEYELQTRWRAKGLKIGFVPSSFVFHYRSVSRGPQFAKGDWFRKGAPA